MNFLVVNSNLKRGRIACNAVNGANRCLSGEVKAAKVSPFVRPPPLLESYRAIRDSGFE